MLCHGQGADHCCYVEGAPCAHVSHDGERWVCGLRRELGSWDAVHVDERYLSSPRPTWDRIERAAGFSAGSYQCGTVPGPHAPSASLRSACCFAGGD